jgi:intracellular septation protein A
MSFEQLLLTFLPLVVFVVVEWKWGMKAGIYAAIALAVAGGVYWYIRFDTWDETLLAELGLLIVMGVVSLRMQDGRIVKFQPAVMSAFFATYCSYLQFTGEPILVRWMPMMAKLSPQIETFMQDEKWVGCLGDSSVYLVYGLIAHSIIVAAAAIKLSSVGWLLCRMTIYPLMMLPAVGMVVCLRR